ncbi:hypothetical protein D3C73_1230900 [compost metagenome]
MAPLADGGHASRLSSCWDRRVVQPGSTMRPLKRTLPLLAWASALTDIKATHSRIELFMTRSLVRCVLVSDNREQSLIGSVSFC